MKSKDRYINLRISEETLTELEELARENHLTKSLVARSLLENCRTCWELLKTEAELKTPENVELENRVIAEVIETLPKRYETPEMAFILSRVMFKVGEALRQGEELRHKEEVRKRRATKK